MSVNTDLVTLYTTAVIVVVVFLSILGADHFLQSSHWSFHSLILLPALARPLANC